MTDKTKPLQECNPRHGWMGCWPGFAALYDPENGRIKKFLIEEELKLHPNSKILDASAGSKPYASIFKNHKYESCDVPGGFYPQKHNFECFLDNIPKPDGSYDAILLTQVLEHIPNPEKVLSEIHRTLKPGGQLLMSVPLNGPLHGEPWHFFQFTHYGLLELARRTNFELTKLEKIGGAFWFFGKHLQDAPRRIMKSFDPGRARKRGQSIWRCSLLSLLFLPFWLTSLIILSGFCRPVCYWLDLLDLPKTLTLGYTAVLKKTK